MVKKTLVFGASLKESRYSNLAIQRLRERNIPVVAYGLRKGMVIGVEIDTEMIAYKNIDTITLYLNPKRQQEYYNYIISLKPKRVIFNPGTENLEFVNLLQKNGIASEVACTLVLLSINKY
ncbi:MAG: CoA-binding protein [Flavobacteriaceae bacterium]